MRPDELERQLFLARRDRDAMREELIAALDRIRTLEQALKEIEAMTGIDIAQVALGMKKANQ